MIDPPLIWNTFLGGSGTDIGASIAVDGSGNVYVAGWSGATWGSPVRAHYGSGDDAYAAKLDNNGNLIWNTFLGGSGSESGACIAVDGSGNVYVTGNSSATWGSPVRAYAGTGDAYAAKLDNNGNLIWNTFLGGGSGSESGLSIAVDGSGNVYAAGGSSATWGSPVRAYAGAGDAFVAKLNSSGSLTWNTFLGGSGANDDAYGIAVDGSGNVYVTGSSAATWGSPVRAHYGSGTDALVAKLNSSGSLTWNTFLGGSGTNYGYNVAVDGSGNVYVAGNSGATWGSPVRAHYGSGTDAYTAKLNSSGSLTWNTFLGGSGSDYGNSVKVDSGGNVYVVGYSNATWGSPSRAYSSGTDGYAAKLDGSGNLIWNTFLGGSGSDSGMEVAVDSGGNVYVAGYSAATWGSPVRAYYGSGTDAWVAMIASTFYSKGSYAVGTASNWNTARDGTGADAPSFDSNCNWVIQNGDSMTLSGSSTWDASATGTVEIESGGTWTNSSSGSVTIGTLQVDNGGTYSHGTTNSLPGTTKTFQATSTVNYSYAGVQNVEALTYGHLTISGSGTKTLAGNASVAAGFVRLGGNL